jgi:tetratricopeptide (TPR) repeat protein
MPGISRARVREARELCNSAAQTAEQAQLKEFAAGVRAGAAAIEAELGYPDEARRQLTSALAAAGDNKDVRSQAAATFARLGDAPRAQQLIAGLAKDYPSDTVLNKAVLPIAQAMIELQRKQPAKALEVLETARSFELGGGPLASTDYWPPYLRAEAYLDLHEPAKAQAEYQEIADHRGLIPISPLYALARLGSARAYAQQGDSSKARSAYQDFFALWKDADPDVPVLKQAKAEYEKLH